MFQAINDHPRLFTAGLLAMAVSLGHLFVNPLRPYVESEPAYTVEEIEAAKESIALSLLGQLQLSMEGLIFLKAMNYLHLGVEHRALTPGEQDRGVRTWGSAQSVAGLDHEDGRNMILNPDEDWRGILGELDRHIRPYTTVHAHDDPVELIPWYQLVVRLNPRLERMYTLGAFYMADYAREPDEAFGLLLAGVKANPFSFEINYALGRLLYDYRHRLEDLEHHHDDHHDHHHHWHHGEDCDGHHDFDDIPGSAEAALLMAVDYLVVAIEAAERQRARQQERGEEGFDSFGDSAYREAYLFLSRTLVELDRLEEALEVAQIGYQRTMNNLLRVQQRIVQAKIDGEDPTAEDADALELDALELDAGI